MATFMSDSVGRKLLKYSIRGPGPSLRTLPQQRRPPVNEWIWKADANASSGSVNGPQQACRQSALEYEALLQEPRAFAAGYHLMTTFEYELVSPAEPGNDLSHLI